MGGGDRNSRRRGEKGAPWYTTVLDDGGGARGGSSGGEERQGRSRVRRRNDRAGMRGRRGLSSSSLSVFSFFLGSILFPLLILVLCLLFLVSGLGWLVVAGGCLALRRRMTVGLEKEQGKRASQRGQSCWKGWEWPQLQPKRDGSDFFLPSLCIYFFKKTVYIGLYILDWDCIMYL